MTNKLINSAIEILGENKKKSMSFEVLWKEIIKKLKISNNDSNSLVGDFYSDLLQNINFVLLENREWSLRNKVPFIELEELSKSLFALNKNEEIKEEDYLLYMSKDEISESKNGRNLKTSNLKLDDEDSEEFELEND